MKVIAPLAVFALVTAAVLGAQQQSPVSRGGTNAVQLDVRVLDDTGQIVRDLRADEFRVFEDNKPQTVTSFQFVDVAAGRSESMDRSVASGRYYLIVIDNQPGPCCRTAQQNDLASRLRLEAAKSIAREFVTNYLEPGDHVALAIAGERQPIVCNFSSSRAEVLDALGRVEADLDPALRRDNPGLPPGAFPIFDTLRTAADWLGQIPGRRKAMVVISEHTFRYNFLMQMSNVTRDVAVAANRANVAMYALDTVTLPGQPPTGFKVIEGFEFDHRRQNRESTLPDLPSLTDGFLLLRSDDVAGALAHIVEETSRYYLLTYSSTDARRDGRFRPFRVEVTRPGVTVQTRAGYVANQKPVKVGPLG